MLKCGKNDLDFIAQHVKKKSVSVQDNWKTHTGFNEKGGRIKVCNATECENSLKMNHNENLKTSNFVNEHGKTVDYCMQESNNEATDKPGVAISIWQNDDCLSEPKIDINCGNKFYRMSQRRMWQWKWVTISWSICAFWPQRQ